MTRTYAQTRDLIKSLTTPEQRKAKGIKLNASHDVLKQVLALLQAQASEPAQAPDTQAQAQETTIAPDHAPEIARLQALLAQAEQDRDTLTARLHETEADRDVYFTQLKQAQAELAQVRDELAQAQAPAVEPRSSQTPSASSTDADSAEQVSEPAPTPPAPEPAPAQAVEPQPEAPAHELTQLLVNRYTDPQGSFKPSLAVSTYVEKHDIDMTRLNEYITTQLFAEPAVVSLLNSQVLQAIAMPAASTVELEPDTTPRKQESTWYNRK